ncbi:MAG: carbon-nitrogen hydrolase family protein [Bacteroidota bacterium]
MKIGIAQIQSKKGDVTHNIAHHLAFIERAIEAEVDLIVFPELSITGYEPALAEQLATTKEDEIFEPFQKLADTSNITIGIGMPILAKEGIYISMLLFQPMLERLVYSKKLLHEDELPFFTSGTHQPSLTIKDTDIALGICYETLQRSHFVEAKENGAHVYVASVAKPHRGSAKAYVHFPAIAQEFQTPILMCNAIGFCDDFVCNGQSAVWNNQGQLLGELDDTNEGMLVYDTEMQKVLSL